MSACDLTSWQPRAAGHEDARLRVFPAQVFHCLFARQHDAARRHFQTQPAKAARHAVCRMGRVVRDDHIAFAEALQELGGAFQHFVLADQRAVEIDDQVPGPDEPRGIFRCCGRGGSRCGGRHGGAVFDRAVCIHGFGSCNVRRPSGATLKLY